MIKAEINLLPPVVKRERFGRLVRHCLSRLYWWALLVTTVTTVALGVSWAVLQQTNRQLQAAAAQKPGQKDDVTMIRNLNQLLRAMQGRVTTSGPWGPAVTAVLAVVPPELASPAGGLQLTQLEVPVGKQQLLIDGTSANRAAVADLEQRLKGLAWVAKVEAPLTNLVVGREGTFSFTLQRKAVAP